MDMTDVAAATAAATTADLDWIMAEFDSAHDRVVYEAVHKARACKAQIVPRLIQALEQATASTIAGNVPEENGRFCAFYLLAEFRAVEALPAIIGAVTLPGEAPFDLFGDAITESLSQVLASVAGEHSELIAGIVRDPAVNEYVRSAAAGALVNLVGAGELARETVIEHLRSTLREEIDRKASCDLWIMNLVRLAPTEARDEIVEAFRRGLVDPLMVSIEDFEQSVREGEAWTRREMERSQPLKIDDALAELKGWWGPAQSVASALRATPDYQDLMAEIDEAPATHHVGRNAPCPCGSGKKFKKCCGMRR